MNRSYLFGLVFLLFLVSSVSAVTNDYTRWFNGTSLTDPVSGYVLQNRNGTLLDKDSAYLFNETAQQRLTNTSLSEISKNLNFTVAMYIKINWSNTDQLFQNSLTAADQFRIEGYNSGNTLRASIRNTTVNFDTASSGVMQNNTWYLILVTYNTQTGLELYVNTTNQTGGLAASTSSYTGLSIGATAADTNYVTGYIDDVKVWNRTLESSEISTVYSEGRGSAGSGSGCITPTEDYTVSGSLTFCTGTYYLNDTGGDGVIKTSGSNMVIDCDGAIFIGNNGTTSKGFRDASNGNNITIKDCIIKDYGTGIHMDMSGSSGLYIYNNTISGARTGGTYLKANNLIIENNTVSCYYSYGGYIDGIEIQGTLSGAIIRGNDVGIGCDSGIKATYNSNNLLIENNLVNQSDRGIRVHNTNNVTIRNNRLYNNTNEADSYLTGIYLQGDYGYGMIRNVMVYNNSQFDQREICWQVAYAENITIENETCYQINATSETYVLANSGDFPFAAYFTPMRQGFFQTNLTGQDTLSGGTANTVSNFFSPQSISRNIVFRNITMPSSMGLIRVENVINLTTDITNYFTINFTMDSALYNESIYYISNRGENSTFPFYFKWGAYSINNWIGNGSIVNKTLTLINAQPNNTATGQPFNFIVKGNGNYNDVKNYTNNAILTQDISEYNINLYYGQGIILGSFSTSIVNSSLNVFMPSSGEIINDFLLTYGFEDESIYTGNFSYKIYLNSTLLESFDNIELSDSSTYSSPNSAYELVRTFNSGGLLVEDLSLLLRDTVLGVNASAQVNFSYTDGTVGSVTWTSTNSSFKSFTFVNPSPSKYVSDIKIYLKEAGGSNAQITNISINYYGSYEFTKDISSYDFPVGEYRVWVYAYNATNGLVAYNSSALFNITTDATIQITVRNYLGNLINSTINFNGTYYFDDVKTLNVRSGDVYSVTVNASGYSSNTSSITIAAGSNYLNFTLFPYNGVNLSIYAFNTLSLITQNMTVIVTSGSANTYYTTTGSLLLSNLGVGLNEFKISNENFSESRYNLFIVDNTYTSLSVYLTPVSSSNNVNFTFYNPYGSKVSNVFAGAYILNNASYVLVGSAYSDIVGKVYFNYDSDYSYLYNYSATGFSSASFILNPPREDNYDIVMRFASSGRFYYALNVTGSTSFNNVSDILTFSYVSTNSSLDNYSYTVSKTVNGRTVALCSESSTTLTDTFTCDLTGYTGIVYVQGVADSQIFYGSYVDIGGRVSLFENMSPADASFIAGFIMLIIAVGAVVFGITGVLIGTVSGSVILYYLRIMTPLNEGMIIIEAIVAIIIIYGFKR